MPFYCGWKGVKGIACQRAHHQMASKCEVEWQSFTHFGTLAGCLGAMFIEMTSGGP
jgi:hypothetical protein